MRLLRKWRLRFHSLFGRSRVESELSDELEDYIERQTASEMAAGASFEEARRRALSELGGTEQVKEECRDARRVRWLEDFTGDLGFALRSLRKAPAFTLTVVSALALCIGLNAAIFSIVDTVLFRPLRFPDQSRLVSVVEGVPSLGYPVLPFCIPDYQFVTANSRSFQSTGLYRTQEYEVAGTGEPRRVEGARLSASMFSVLGVFPTAGRAFTAEEDERANRVAVLSDGFARSLFGTPKQAVGRTILLNRIAYEVIGVMPGAFSFPIRGARFNDNPAELFLPVSWSHEDQMQTVSNFDYSMIARLRPNASVAQANAEVQVLVKRLTDGYPARIKEMLRRVPNFSLESHAIPFREEFAGNVRRPLLFLLMTVGIVLLIGCGDVANLMFSRMVGRQREFVLRSTLGASFGRLTRQLLAEGLVLSSGGGAIGLIVAFWAIPLLVRFAPDGLPRLNEIGLNWRIAAFVAVVTLVTPLLFCLAPVMSSLRAGAGEHLRGEGRTNTQNKRERRVMSLAVIGQFCLAFLLLTTAGLLLRSFLKASGANPGFQSDHIVSMRIALPEATYKTPSAITSLFNRLLVRLNALPGVKQVGAISDLPMDSTSNVIISAEGIGSDIERVDTLFYLGDALGALRISLLKGRLLQPSDYIGNKQVVVISEGLAKRLWARENPIGRRIKFGVDDPANDQPWLTIVGVVADVKAKLTSQTPRLAVFAIPPDWVNTMNVLVRTSGDPRAVTSGMRFEVSQIDRNLPAGTVKTMDQVLDESLSAERFRTWLLTMFAIAAVLLATLGIAGLLAYLTAQRMREFGVRVALGANRGNLLGMVFRHCLELAGAGVAIGLVASLFTTKVLAAFLYDTSPLDPPTLAGVSCILTLVALGAAIVPAWRVLHVDPAQSLRAE